MARFPEFDQTSMTDEQRKVVHEIVSGPHGSIIGPYHAWLHSPELARRVRNLSEYIRFKSSVPKRLAELCILVSGRYWKAEFEYWTHAKLAKDAGVEEAVIAAIAKKQRPVFKQADDELVYTICMEMYETHRISDRTYQQAVKAFGLPVVVDLMTTLGFYCMVSVCLNAFETPIPAGERSPFAD
jgi:4-carboxymuconolactone decarboxylase